MAAKSSRLASTARPVHTTVDALITMLTIADARKEVPDMEELYDDDGDVIAACLLLSSKASILSIPPSARLSKKAIRASKQQATGWDGTEPVLRGTNPDISEVGMDCCPPAELLPVQSPLPETRCCCCSCDDDDDDEEVDPAG